jgi:hypothetical protein
MSRTRLNLFIEPEHAKRLDELATMKGLSKSSIIAAALASFLSPDSGDQREAAIAKRLDRLSRQLDKLELSMPIVNSPEGGAALFLDWFKLQARDVFGIQVDYMNQGIF